MPDLDEGAPDEPVVREILSLLRTDMVQGTAAFVERVRERIAAVEGAGRGPSFVSVAADVVVEFTNLLTYALGTKNTNGGDHDDDRKHDNR